MDTRSWLEEISRSPLRISHFVCLLAELEAIGAHKLRCCVEEYAWGNAERRHLREETRHAAILQTLLDEDRDHPVSNARVGEEIRRIAHEYFEPLDHGTSDQVDAIFGGHNPHLCYLIVSYLVECRALEVYGIFSTRVPTAALRSVVTRIIKDEEGHLDAMEREISRAFGQFGQTFRAEDFQGLEAHLYANMQRQFDALTLSQAVFCAV